MRETLADQKKMARGAEGETLLLEKIAGMKEPDRGLAKKIHAIVKANAPTLTPTTWYGMPAYSKDGRAVLFFQDAAKFKARYATLGFNDSAFLDEADMWATSYALKALTPATEAKIAALEDLSKKPTPRYPKGSPFRAKAAASTLKRFANWLAQEGILADVLGQSLLRHVKKPKVMDNVRQPLSDEEIDAILSAYQPGTLAYTGAALMIGTGIRFNEARELRVGDVDFANGLLTVRGETSKTRNTRTVDVHDAVLKELDRYLRQRPTRKPDDPLLVTDEARAYTKAGFNKVFRRLAKASGVLRFHAHLTRHTWATRFEGDILELKRQGGWSDWKQVERYRHAQRPKRESLVNPLNIKKTVITFRRSA